ncbi:MAG: T9SS type A sorting domain-containing protein [Ignavibacteria bacterium]|jgi:hypothetical protein|nr:T9SS type A sorting domain-containing protein [Ignavibacteria bacterium]
MHILFRALSVLILLSGINFSQTNGFKLAGRWPDGPSSAVAIDGNYAYINNGSALEIVDISNAASFKSAGRLDLADIIHSISASGAYAYVSGANGFYVIDVTDKTFPRMAAAVSIPYTASMLVKDNFVYAACPDPGFLIIDVSNPSQPKIAASIFKDYLATGVFVADSLAYVCCMDSGLYVVNVKNKTAPSILGHYNFDQKYRPKNVYVKDSIAYVTSAENKSSYTISGRFHAINIKNPSNIFEESGISLTGDWHATGEKIAVNGNYAYVTSLTDVGNYVTIADVSNPCSVKEVLKKNVENAFDLAIKDKRLFVTADYKGLLSFDLTNPESLLEDGSFRTAGLTGTVVRKGDYLYVAKNPDGIRVLDISKPSNPSEVSSYEGPLHYEGCNTLFVKDTILFAGIWGTDFGFSVFSLANMPSLKKIIALQPDNVAKIEVAGNYAYTAGVSEFLIYDVTDPYHPKKIFSYSTDPVRNLDLAVNGSTLYLLEKLNRLKIFDVSNPAGAALISEIPVANALNISLDGGYLYVNINYDGTKIFDVSDPKNPKEIGKIAEPDAYKIIARDGYLYAVFAAKGLKVFNVKNPATPYLVRSDETVKNSSDMFVDKDYIIISGNPEGLSIFTNDITTSVGAAGSRIKDFALLQNYPNPFNPATMISYSIPRQSFVNLKVFDMLGREVASLVSKEQSEGEYKVQFNASNLPSGMYIYTIQAGEFRASKKLMLVK